MQQLQGGDARLSHDKTCPVAGCACRISCARDLMRDDALAAKLREVPNTVSFVKVRSNGDVRWDNDGSPAGETCIDLTPDGDAVVVMVDGSCTEGRPRLANGGLR